MTTILEAAQEYTKRGWSVIPFAEGKKGPEGRDAKGWTSWRFKLEELPKYFKEGVNIGVLLGNASGGLIDIDLDAKEASYLAPRFLPPTPAVFGRASKEESHWLYKVSAIPSTAQRETPPPEGAMIVELRSSGGQTVFPPSVHPSGELYEWNARGEPAEVDAEELLKAVDRLAACALLARSWPQRGARNKAALALAGALLRGSWDTDSVRDFIVAVAEAAGDEEAESRTLSIASTKDKLDAGGEVTGWPALSEIVGKDVVSRVQKWLRLVSAGTIGSGLDRTDLGNARRLAALFGEDLKYSPKLGWLVWDGTRWQEDTAQTLVNQRATRVVDEVVREAMTKTGDEQKKHFAWAVAMQSAGHLHALVDLARDLERIAVSSRDLFDEDPLTLNCPNGTLDLTTMELREHRREDRGTKITSAIYDPRARSARWEKFLLDTVDGDMELLEFLQQAAGYSLSGLTDEEKLFFVHGPTASGKSTFVESLKAALGDYAATTDFETFLTKKGDAGVRNDIARLAYVRLVSSIEVEHGKKLAEGLVKTITGGDLVSARFLYKELFEFRPKFKLWLVANTQPRVDDESAIWRRILVVPFEHTVPPAKRDMTLKRELIDSVKSGPAILAWAVEGFTKWRAAGALVAPKRVVEATAEYKLEMDPLKDFLEALCVVDIGNPECVVLKSDLREAYVEWCKRNSAGWPLNDRDFKAKLEDMGVKEHRGAQGVRAWVGISLLRDAASREEKY